MNNIEGLDAACARAMGWTIDGYADIDGDGPSVARWKRGSDYELRIMEPLNDPPPPRRYSTDPSTLDEKLAWLAKYAKDQADEDYIDSCLVITFSNEKSYVLIRVDPKRGVQAQDQWIRVAMRCGFHPEDLHEATARLVVAVKEAMGDA